MTYPVWTTTAGKIASINEREYYSKTLQASTDDEVTEALIGGVGTLRYTVIAGKLPPGLQLSP